MEKEKKNEDLLSEIGTAAGIVCLSDLYYLKDSSGLSETIKKIPVCKYNCEEWNEAACYIGSDNQLDKNHFSSAEEAKNYLLEKGVTEKSKTLEFVFYRVKKYEWTIKNVLAGYLRSHGKSIRYHSISNRKDRLSFGKGQETEYLVFNRIYVPYETEKTKTFIKENRIHAKIVALCRNDKDGMKAMEKGSDYALLLPLSPKMIIHCYKHFQPNQK